MKNLKRIALWVIVTGIALTSCHKPDNGGDIPVTPVKPPVPVQPTAPAITIPSTENLSPVLNNTGGTATVRFTAKDSWTAEVINTKADAWCSVNPTSGGAGDATITINTTPNDTYEERRATVQIKSGSTVKSVNVTQKQKDNITVTTSRFEIDAAGGEIQIQLKTNIQFEYKISAESISWISYVSTKAYGSKTLTFKIAKNESLERRQGTIVISGGGFSEAVTIYQAGEAATMILSNSVYNLDDEGGLVSVEVSSNVDVAVVIPANVSWITEERSKSMSTSTYRLSVAANTSNESRSANVDFVNKANNLKESITINQSGSSVVFVTGVTLDKSSLELTEGDEYGLTATVTPDDATNKNVTWSSDNTSVVTVSQNGGVRALKSGTATITVKTEDGNHTASCTVTVKAKTYPVTGVTLDKSSLSLKKGESETLTATIAPANATNKNVVWSSSNPGVATVDSNGKVTAVGGGDSIVTVTTSDGGKTATCSVSVTVPVNGVSLDKSSLALTEGDEYGLTATVTPDDATNKNVTWSSDNTSVVTVSQNGGIRALKSGTATITVKTEDGNHTASCTVTVKAKTYPVTGVTLDKSSLSLKKGESETLTATIAPANATNKNVVWSSSNPGVATVDSNGKVTAVGGGDAIVTVATSDGGKTATCSVSVTVPVNGVSLDKSSLELTEGDEYGLTATVTPDDATNKNVTWSSDNTSVVTVSQNGGIRALKSGTATITVKTEDGNHTASCTVTVKAKTYPVTGVTLDKSSLSLKKGESETLTATIAPANATNKNVVWSSSNPGVATVDSNGKVTAVGGGDAIVTVTTIDGGLQAQCIIIVEVPVLGISLNRNSIDIGEGEEFMLEATITPEDATYKSVSWSTDNYFVATVDQNGCVRALKSGTATITVKTEDGDYTAICIVHVKYIPISSIVFEKSKYELNVGEVIKVKATVLPANASDKTLKWFVGDATKASVSDDGEVKALSPGKTRLYARSLDEKVVASCEIVIKGDGMDPSIGDWGNGEGGEGIAD